MEYNPLSQQGKEKLMIKKQGGENKRKINGNDFFLSNFFL